MEYRKKMLSILFFLVVGTFLYQIYRYDIYVWFCDHEQNQGACTVAGILFEEKNDVVNSTKYYKKSCELDYSQGCHKLAKLLEKNSQKEQAVYYHERACKLGYELSCGLKK